MNRDKFQAILSDKKTVGSEEAPVVSSVDVFRVTIELSFHLRIGRICKSASNQLDPLMYNVPKWPDTL